MALEEQINSCCTDNKSLTLPNTNEHEIILKNAVDSGQQPILYQNTPNPHDGECTIRYFVPSFKENCEIRFFDTYGNLVDKVKITLTGMGQLNVHASDLSSGSYTYALVIDGAVVATKMMIRQ